MGQSIEIHKVCQAIADHGEVEGSVVDHGAAGGVDYVAGSWIIRYSCRGIIILWIAVNRTKYCTRITFNMIPREGQNF